MCDVAYTSKCLAAKAISTNGGKILELFKLGSGESLTKDRQVFALYNMLDTLLIEPTRDIFRPNLTSIPCPLSVI